MRFLSSGGGGEDSNSGNSFGRLTDIRSGECGHGFGISSKFARLNREADIWGVGIQTCVFKTDIWGVGIHTTWVFNICV